MTKDSPPPPPPTSSWSSLLPRMGRSGSGGTGSPAAASPPSPPTPPPPPKMYHPSVFRYVCRGKLSLDSVERPHEAGVCRGLRSQLEHVDRWKLSTEEEAIRVFQAKSALHDDGTAADAAGGGEAAGHHHNGGVSSAHALQSIYLTNVLVYPSADNHHHNDDKEQKDNHPNKPNQKAGETDIVRASEEEWSCYGSTEVDLLVLRPEDSKEETIAAVSPYCAPGMTIRDIRLPEYGGTLDRTSTVRLGFLEILYQSSLEDEDDDREDAGADRAATNATNAATGAKRRGTTGSGTTEKPPFWIRFGTSSTNLWNQMGINARLLVQATQEDFFDRTLAASEKVLAEFPRTLERTKGLMVKVLTGDWSSPPPSGGGGGPPPPF